MLFLAHFLSTYYFLIYPSIIAGMFVEGTLTLLVFGALSHDPNINLGFVIIFAVFGELLHDTIFWFVGKKIRLAKNKRDINNRLKKMLGFLENTNHYFFGVYIFLSKFIWNFNRITVISVGYSGMKFGRFIKISILSTILWVVSLLSVGYLFADQTQLLEQKLWVSGISFAGIFLVVIAIQISFSIIMGRYSNSDISNNNKKQNKFFLRFFKRKSDIPADETMDM